MRCNQEQWEEIKPLLDKHSIKFKDIDSFSEYHYLVNNHEGEKLNITNVNNYDSVYFGRKLHEEWDKNIFLTACGINDEFVLPDKWWLKVTDENRADVNHWRRNIVKYHNSDCPYSYIRESGCGDDQNSPEITTEQFYKYVFKKEMNTKQTLTRAQLISLHNQFDCSTWKTEIECILIQYPIAADNTEIEIPQACIDKLIKDGSKDQKAAVEKLGLKLVVDNSVKVPNLDVRLDGVEAIENRVDGEYKHKSFFLYPNFNWELKEDSEGALLLIPTKKD